MPRDGPKMFALVSCISILYAFLKIRPPLECPLDTLLHSAAVVLEALSNTDFFKDTRLLCLKGLLNN